MHGTLVEIHPDHFLANLEHEVRSALELHRNLHGQVIMLVGATIRLRVPEREGVDAQSVELVFAPDAVDGVLRQILRAELPAG